MQCYLAELHDSGNGLSLQTCNFYLQAIQQFCRFMVRDGRAVQAPLDHLQGQNVQTDRRHDRRALSVDECRWLLATTLDGPVRGRATGPERVLVYRMALEAGLRASEIRGLTRGSFDFDLRSPTVTVSACYSKRRGKDLLPLRAGLADDLRQRLAAKLPATSALTMPTSKKTAKMLRADLAAARDAWLNDATTPAERAARERTSFLVYRDENGLVADFHALRHTFISNLAASGVHPKIAQLLARH